MREFDFQRQLRRKPARCNRTSVSGRTIVTTVRIDWKTSIHLEEDPAVVICEPSPAFQLIITPRDDQLMSEHRILRLKPALRLERRGQHGQNNRIGAIIAPI